MQRTPNYNLLQYEGTDKFLKEDLNDSLSKIDTAIGDMQVVINNSDVSMLSEEVVTARKGEASLGDKIDVIDTSLSDITTLKPSGLTDSTDLTNIQAAINSGKRIKLAEGTFNLTGELSLPETSPVYIVGAGFQKTFLKAVGVFTSVIKKGNGLAIGSTIKDLTIDCDLKATHGIQITSSKQMKLNRIRVLDPLGDHLLLGGDASMAFYEAQVSEIMLEYDGNNNALNRPNYGINLLTGAHDTYYSDIVVKNVKLAGIKDSESSNNFYENVHVYGYPEPDFRQNYAIHTYGGSIIRNLYADSCSVAGVKISGNNVVIMESLFFWLTSIPTANAYEIDSGIDYIKIMGNNYSNMTSGVAISYLGTKGSNITILSKDTMQLSGILDIQQSANQVARVRINANSGSTAYNEAQTTGGARWRYGKNGTAESGSNAGSDFAIERYSDGGNYIDTPITIYRNNGLITMMSGGLNVAGTWDKPFRINGSYFWCDSSNRFRYSPYGTAPTSETSGNVLAKIVSVPATATSTGEAGQIAYDTSYMYFCIGTNSWKRVAIASW